jgi:hypothetical protein
MRGPVKSAASAVGSVVAGATAAVESAIPSTLPVPTLDVVPEPSASEASDDEDDVPADSASSSALAGAGGPPRYAPPARTHLPPRPKHYVNRTVHRKH